MNYHKRQRIQDRRKKRKAHRKCQRNKGFPNAKRIAENARVLEDDKEALFEEIIDASNRIFEKGLKADDWMTCGPTKKKRGRPRKKKEAES